MPRSSGTPVREQRHSIPEPFPEPADSCGSVSTTRDAARALSTTNP